MPYRPPPSSPSLCSAQAGPSRRALLAAAAVLPLAGCGTGEQTSSGSSPSSSPPSSSTGRRRSSVSPSAYRARFTALERKYGARLGVYALDTGSGATVSYRADERFAFCSTFKAFAAAAVLHRNPRSHLDKRVTYTEADVDSISPVTEDHIATGMTIGQLCDAAVRYSDGTAGNLLMRDIGGPEQLTAYLRGLGDKVSRMDNYEPELNQVGPGDPRDTTTPEAVAADYRKLVLGDALSDDERTLLKGWLLRNTTGVGKKRIRAGVPRGWKVADKTGTGNWGRANDIAVVWPPHKAPLVMAVLSDRPGYRARPKNSLIAKATEQIVSVLT
ncbi:class A beta-lactamase [Streptomyces smyrnaeus]|uniref:Beta-lactamase n=1 Tax=Streptomyces smyrnaeus TaxID=1387713 RepID=A0ABS3Y3X7_9ACTN|nr:class A beta-lactamase [Streptomyces smyrnaeus]MBO8202362.1 class A beta-lactamase [Streptomyces smyrnaeus]